MKIFEKYLTFLTGLTIAYNPRTANILLALTFLYSLYIAYKHKTLKDEIKHIVTLNFLNKDIRKNIFEIILLCGFAVFASPNIIFSLKAFVLFVFLLFIVVYILRNYSLERASILYFFYGYLLAILMYFTYYIFGGNSHINGKSLGLMMSIYYLLVYKKDYFKIPKQLTLNTLIILLYFIIGFIIFKNHSATAKVSFLTSPFICLYFYKISIYNAKKKIILFIIFISMFIPSIIYFTNINKVFQTLPNLEASFKHRICIAKFSIDKFIENPLSGNGFKASRFYESDKNCFIITKEEMEKISKKYHLGNEDVSKINEVNILYNAGFHPHNFILQILFEIGIFGIFVFIYFIKNILKIIDISQGKMDFALKAGIIYNFFVLYIISYSLWETWLLTSIFSILFIFKDTRR